jgi:hypothetical protein
MSLPVAKLGTLALRTLSKPIASRLKNQAAVHPKFRNFIICIAQVGASSSSSGSSLVLGADAGDVAV